MRFLGTTEKKGGEKQFFRDWREEIKRTYSEEADSQIRKISEILKCDLKNTCCVGMLKSSPPHKNPSPIRFSMF